jgi:hypothetical protein
MADPSSLTISIDRTSMSLSALVLTGHDDPARVLSVSGYREPPTQARITYAPTGDGHGDIPLAWSYQQTLIGFNVFDESQDGETEARARIAELAAALGRLSYSVTITVDDADPETWTCDPGSIAAADDRTTSDLQTHTNVWAVTIPAYPIRSV